VVGGAIEEVIEGAEEEHGAGPQEEEDEGHKVTGIDELEGDKGVRKEGGHGQEPEEVRPDVHGLVMKGEEGLYDIAPVGHINSITATSFVCFFYFR